MRAFFPLSFNSKSSIDLSLKDWDVKEQENLREVQKILDRTDEILEVMRFSSVRCAGWNDLCVLSLESAAFL